MKPIPQPGQLWSVAGPTSHAIYLGDGMWTVLVRSHPDEFSLEQAMHLAPLALCTRQPAGIHWADQFDALAAASGLETSWAQEVEAYKAEGLARALPRR